MIYPLEPWNWPADWFTEFLKMRETSKTYVKVDEFFSAKKRWIDRIFNRYLFWNTIKIDEASVSMEILDWLCKDNTKSKWTLSLYLKPVDILEVYPETNLILIFYFKDRSDLLLFKMRW